MAQGWCMQRISGRVLYFMAKGGLLAPRSSIMYGAPFSTRSFVKACGEDPSTCRIYVCVSEAGLTAELIPDKIAEESKDCMCCRGDCAAPAPGKPVFFPAYDSGDPYVYVQRKRQVKIVGTADAYSLPGVLGPVMLCDRPECWEKLVSYKGYARVKSTSFDLNRAQVCNIIRRMILRRVIMRHIEKKRAA